MYNEEGTEATDSPRRVRLRDGSALGGFLEVRTYTRCTGWFITMEHKTGDGRSYAQPAPAFGGSDVCTSFYYYYNRTYCCDANIVTSNNSRSCHLWHHSGGLGWQTTTLGRRLHISTSRPAFGSC